MAYLTIACRVLLAVVFLVAVVGKLRGDDVLSAFARSLRTLRILPGAAVRPAAVAVLAAEAAVVLLFVHPSTVAPGFALALGLSALFAAGIGAALVRTGSAVCRCFGATATPLGRGHLLRAGLLAAVAAAGLGSTPTGPVSLGGAAVAAATGFVLAVLVIFLDDILHLFLAEPVPRRRDPLTVKESP